MRAWSRSLEWKDYAFYGFVAVVVVCMIVNFGMALATWALQRDLESKWDYQHRFDASFAHDRNPCDDPPPPEITGETDQCGPRERARILAVMAEDRRQQTRFGNFSATRVLYLQPPDNVLRCYYSTVDSTRDP